MESYIYPDHFDLITPDGRISNIHQLNANSCECTVLIEKISPAFVGYRIDSDLVCFNGKSTLAQLGLDLIGQEIHLDAQASRAEVKVLVKAIGNVGMHTIKHLHVGSSVGKLFAADERRLVRNPDYLSRMFGRSDRKGRPLLSLGGLQGSNDLLLEVHDGHTVAYLTLQYGRVHYEEEVFGLIPTIGKALEQDIPTRGLLPLHQKWCSYERLVASPNELLLAKTLPLHIRTVFARVVNDLLPPGYKHTSANVLQPDTTASGDIYELYGESNNEISDIPLEFYTLEPHREHVFFRDRDQLQSFIEDPRALFRAFETAPKDDHLRCAVYVVKGTQMAQLKPNDWIARDPQTQAFPGHEHGSRQALMVERYIQQQPSYPFFEAIQSGLIQSEGILLVRHFPSPLMKQVILNERIQRFLQGIYFLMPSRSHEEFFSQEDRALLHDLTSFAIPVFWVDEITGQILRYVEKPERGTGMFVPQNQVENFLNSCVFGIYGSNLLEGDFEQSLQGLLKGVQELKKTSVHPILQANTPLALITGGGPGAMEVGNRVAQSLDILSCANLVDFRAKDDTVVNEQHQNPHIEAKMTYRLAQLVERQAEFHLDFPIFLTGGIGTDFEFCLEEVRRKVGSCAPNPVLLFGKPEYWRDKITSRFQRNRKEGTISGSEWISNCFYCVQSAEEGLQVYQDFFSNKLEIGPNGPIYEEGFVTVKEQSPV